MRIRDILIRRYKSLRDFHMEGIDDLAVLIGCNSSGKTNLLEALVLFFSGFEWTSGSITSLTEHHWFRRNTSSPIEFEISVELEDFELEGIFGSTLSKAIKDRHMSKKGGLEMKLVRSIDRNGSWTTHSINMGDLEFVLKGSEAVPLFQILVNLEAVPHLATVGIIGQDAERESVLYAVDYEDHRVFKIGPESRVLWGPKGPPEGDLTDTPIEEWCKSEEMNYDGQNLTLTDLGLIDTPQILTNLVTLMKNVLSLPPQLDLPQVSFERTSALKDHIPKLIVEFYESDRGEQYEFWNELNTIFGKEVSGKLIPAQDKLHYEIGGRRYPFHFIGGGYQNWLSLVWYLVNERLINKGSIVLIEEPERHLHPRLAKRVFRFIRSQCTSIQIFLTTHSTVFMDQCNNEEIWQMSEVKGATVSSRIEGVENLREVAFLLGIAPSDVMMANNILFVEGPTDALVIRSWAKLMGIPLDYPRVKIIPLRGAGKGRYHLGVWTEAAVAAEIPLFVLLDGDKAGRDAAKKLKEKKKGKIPIDPKRVYNLKMRNIEDYYPGNLILEALVSRFALDEEEAKSLKAAIKSKNRVKSIKSWSNEHKKVPPKIWKAVAAEYVAENMKEKDILPEIRDRLHRLDELFEREEGT